MDFPSYFHSGYCHAMQLYLSELETPYRVTVMRLHWKSEGITEQELIEITDQPKFLILLNNNLNILQRHEIIYKMIQILSQYKNSKCFTINILKSSVKWKKYANKTCWHVCDLSPYQTSSNHRRKSQEVPCFLIIYFILLRSKYFQDI
jgi:hypothetical protein